MRKLENDCVGCDVCYGCGRKQVEHVYCDGCGYGIDDVYEHDGGEYCYDCWIKARGYDDSLTVENAELWGRKNPATIELNGFLAWEYSIDQIEQILWADFMKQPAYKQTDDIDDFAENDQEGWLDEVGL